MAGTALCYTPGKHIRAPDARLPAGWRPPDNLCEPREKLTVKIPNDLLGQVQQQFGQFVPDMARAAREDAENHARAAVMSVISKLELVTREEFDAQQAVLLRTRERLEQLEKRVAELEQTPSTGTSQD